MRIRAVGHACLEIETGGLRIVTDPWWEGPAFGGLWRSFPAPRPDGLTTRAIDYLFLSRPRGDHLHLPTLRTLRHAGTVLVPELVAGTMAPTLRDQLGFCDVIELRHGRTITLRRGLRATCYVNLGASVLVLEDGDRVLVHAGSAIHESSPAIVEHFCRLITSRHPSIDTLFLGSSGASWIPDALRLPGKDDRHAARARALHLVDTFADIARRLRPRVACALPLAPLHVNTESLWVNHVRFDVLAPDAAFRKRCPSSSTRAHHLVPGDVIEGVEVVSCGRPPPTRADLDEALRAVPSGPAPLNEAMFRSLLARLETRLRIGAARLEGRPPFSIALRFRDVPGSIAHIRFDGHRAHVEPRAPRRCDAEQAMNAAVLEDALATPHGIESITVALGAVVSLSRLDALGRVEDLLRIIPPRAPHAPGLRRALGAAWSQRWPLALTAGARWRLMPPMHDLQGLASAPVTSGLAA